MTWRGDGNYCDQLTLSLRDFWRLWWGAELKACGVLIRFERPHATVPNTERPGRWVSQGR